MNSIIDNKQKILQEELANELIFPNLIIIYNRRAHM